MTSVSAPHVTTLVGLAAAREATRVEGVAENQKVAQTHQRKNVTTSKHVGADRSHGRSKDSDVPDDGRGNKLDLSI